MTSDSNKVYDVLNKLNINYSKYEHPPVYTIEEASKYNEDYECKHAKNLFLRNKKGNNHYLVIISDYKTADIKDIAKSLNDSRLSFASCERLQKYLGLEPGAVSPFGLINDKNHEVTVLLDKDLVKSEYVAFHPNVNTATITLTSKDFIKFLEWSENDVLYVDID